MALVLAGCAALLYGVADFSGGFAAGRSRILSVLVLSQAMGILVALAGLALVGHASPSRADLSWGLLAGITGSMGLFMLYGGIAKSIVAIVSPASAVVGAVLPVLFGLLLGERPAANAVAGSLLCLPAILLLTWEGSGERGGKSIRTALVYGVLAGLGFGVFFISLSRTSPAAGLWPLVAARAASPRGTVSPSRFQELMMAEQAGTKALTYNVSQRWDEGMWMDHPNFGLGKVQKRLGRKVDVLFRDGLKTLVSA